MRAPTLLAAFLAAFVLVRPAVADEATEKQARALFAQGNQRFDAEDNAGALELYRAAYAKWANPKILWNVGTTLRRLARYAEAADTYEAYLKDAAADPAKNEEGARLLAELEQRVARLRITVDDPGAKVRVDGRIVSQPDGVGGGGPIVISLRVDAGPHTLLAEKDGTAPAVANITAVAGKEQGVALHLAASVVGPTAPAAAAAPAVGPREDPVPPHHVPAGSHMHSKHVAGIVLGAAGVVGIGVGAALGALAASKNSASKADGHCDANSVCDATGYALRVDSFHLATGSTVGFVAAGVLLAGGVVLFATAPGKQVDKVTLAVGTASFSLSGGW